MRQRLETMKVTTVRFGTDLWTLLQQEAAHSGVSVSQYIREAALARAAGAASARGEDPLAVLASATAAGPSQTPTRRRDTGRQTPAQARQAAIETRSEARATVAEAKQAVRQAHRLSGKQP